MKRRKLISVLLAATMMAAMFAGCGSDAASTDAKENADGADSTEAGGVKEFTAFFAVPGSEINDDNEIQQIIADKTGVKVKETWLTGQTAVCKEVFDIRIIIQIIIECYQNVCIIEL